MIDSGALLAIQWVDKWADTVTELQMSSLLKMAALLDCFCVYCHDQDSPLCRYITQLSSTTIFSSILGFFHGLVWFGLLPPKLSLELALSNRSVPQNGCDEAKHYHSRSVILMILWFRDSLVESQKGNIGTLVIIGNLPPQV